jgi:hypothetical protein
VSDQVIAEALGPDGRRVEIHSRRWSHVLEEHSEMVGYLEETVKTIEHPEHREPDVAPGRERYFRRCGPQRWIRAVVEFAGETDRLVTAFPQANDPPGWRGRRR